MKSLPNVIGILLILFGVISLAYEGITYKTQKKIVEIGELQVTQETKKTIPLPPILGGLSLVAGIALIVAVRINRK